MSKFIAQHDTSGNIRVFYAVIALILRLQKAKRAARGEEQR